MDSADGRPFLYRIKSQNMNFEEVKLKMQSLIYNTQEDFCKEIQKIEELNTFKKNKWMKSEDSEGIAQVLEDGDIFEKVGVSISKVSGVLPQSAYLLLKKRNYLQKELTKVTYFSTGISGVVYPKNPHIPILSFLYRYFQMNDGEDIIWWFGGGSDLTPCILNKMDCQHFHKVLKQCCDKYAEYYYKSFKKSCDEHFYVEHRGEHRGIGGIFFNELSSPDIDTCFQFVATCMHNIIPSYIPIVLRNKEKKYFSKDKDWQLIQRGRYVEFCLICDKATKIVLMTPGVEHENILMCLPPSAKWHYNSIPDENSEKYELHSILCNPIEWI